MAGAGNPAQTNAFQQSAQGFQAAGLGSYGTMAFQPEQVSTEFGYQPSSVQTGFGYQPGQVSTSYGYRPTDVQTRFGYRPTDVQTRFGYRPTDVSAQAAVGGIQTYMNPYTEEVIGQTQADIERQRQMATNQLGAQASQVGAFGGSRQGVAESLTNREFARQAAETAAQLRAQGFQTALGAAQQDVAQNLQAQLANQAARAEAAQFGQQTGLQAQLANQAARARATEFGQQTGLQGQLANQAARAEAAQFGQQTGLQAAMANQAARARAAEFGQQTGLQAQMANQAAGARAAEFGQQQGLQAQLANQAAARNAAALRLQGAGQLADIANLGFGRAMDITRQQQQQGLAMQALNQQIIDAARQQYAGFTGAPERAIQLPIQAVSAGSAGQGTTSTTTSQRPGLLDYLSLGAKMAAAIPTGGASLAAPF